MVRVQKCFKSCPILSDSLKFRWPNEATSGSSAPFTYLSPEANFKPELVNRSTLAETLESNSSPFTIPLPHLLPKPVPAKRNFSAKRSDSSPFTYSLPQPNLETGPAIGNTPAKTLDSSSSPISDPFPQPKLQSGYAAENNPGQTSISSTLATDQQNHSTVSVNEKNLSEINSEGFGEQANPRARQERRKTYFIQDGAVHLLPNTQGNSLRQRWEWRTDLFLGNLFSLNIDRKRGMIKVANEMKKLR